MTATRTGDLGELLLDALAQSGKAGFLVYEFAADRDLLAGVLLRAGTADVWILHSADCAHAYRTPAGPPETVLRPAEVWWWYGGPAERTIRALLALPAPGGSDAPARLMPIPAPTGVAGDLTPVRIRVPLWPSARPDWSSDEPARWA